MLLAGQSGGSHWKQAVPRRADSFAESAITHLDSILTWYARKRAGEMGTRGAAELFRSIERLGARYVLDHQLREFAQPVRGGLTPCPP